MQLRNLRLRLLPSWQRFENVCSVWSIFLLMIYLKFERPYFWDLEKLFNTMSFIKLTYRYIRHKDQSVVPGTPKFILYLLTPAAARGPVSMVTPARMLPTKEMLPHGSSNSCHVTKHVLQ
jgi:hypothetical protein